MSNHFEMRYKSSYIAKLRDDGSECTEVVFFNGQLIHKATFPAKNLGSSKRGDYLASMVATVAREHAMRTKDAMVADYVSAGLGEF